MKRIYLVRHGETDWNYRQIYMGQEDIPMNETGFQRTQELAKYFQAKSIEHIYVSDLTRTQQTANEIFTNKRIEKTLSKDLREVHFGYWQGLTYKEITQKYPKELQKWLSDPVYTSPTGGETLNEVASRLKRFLGNIMKESISEVVCVTHGGPIKLILCLSLCVELTKYWQFKIDPAGIAVIEFYEKDCILCQLLNHKTSS